MDISHLPNDLKWKKIKYQAGVVPIQLFNLGIFPSDATVINRVVIQLSIDNQDTKNTLIFPSASVEPSDPSESSPNSTRVHKYGEMRYLVTSWMISARNRGDFIFPKGSIEQGESLLNCAKREALEEAGVTCNFLSISGIPSYQKQLPIPKLLSKTVINTKNILPCSIGEFHSIRKDLVKSRVLYFLGIVNSTDPEWKESEERSRFLFPFSESFKVCTRLGTFSALTGAKDALFQLFNYFSVISTMPPPIGENWKTHVDLSSMSLSKLGKGEKFSEPVKMETRDLHWLQSRLKLQAQQPETETPVSYAKYENSDSSLTFNTFPGVNTGHFDGITLSAQGIDVRSAEWDAPSIETSHYSIRNFITSLNMIVS